MADNNDFFTGYLSGQCENRGGGMFGGGWEGIIGLVVILALLGGGLGFDGFGGGLLGGGRSGAQGMATRADINAGFQFNDLQNGIRGIERGLCDGFYGVQNGINSLSAQMAQCCCDNRAAISDLKYTIATEDCATRNLMQTNTRDIIESQNAGTRAILDYLTQNELATLRNENQALRFSASQSNQNAVLMAAMDANKAEILRRTGNECPIPAYVVPNPNCCYGNPIGVSYGYNQGNSCMGCAA